MISFDDVTITYEGRLPVVRRASFTVDEGQLCLLVGPTGTGKSTILGAVNGLVPRFTGGRLSGRVSVAGRDTADTPVSGFADVVGRVGQDPAREFVCDLVEDELAYGLEQLAMPPAAMRKRVEETLDLLGIADLRRRALDDLSGGQQQRVAIGAALVGLPQVLVLDEPTSALDPTGAEEVLAAITRLVHDLGLTVLMAEHRLERVVQYVDKVVAIDPEGGTRSGTPGGVLPSARIRPPLVDLALVAGWDPPPLSTRDARRLAPRLAARLGPPPTRTQPVAKETAATVRRLVVAHGDIVAVGGIDLDVPAGQVTALMGRNGSGKSSLLWAIHGAGPTTSGRILRGGDGSVGLVPQAPGDLLYLDSVDAECAQADTEHGTPSGACRRLLDGIVDGIPGDTHPRDLSEGQRLALVLAIQLTGGPGLVLLDEPTRGLDYGAKRRLADVLGRLADDGRGVVVATHDVEFAATIAHRVVVLAEGEIVAEGTAAEVLTSSPAFAPQVTKVLGTGWLTVDEVAASLAEGVTA